MAASLFAGRSPNGCKLAKGAATAGSMFGEKMDGRNEPGKLLLAHYLQ